MTVPTAGTEGTAGRSGADGRGGAWWWTVGWVLLGVGLLAVSVALGRPVSERVADEQAFLAAQPCGGEGSADCLRTIRGTVLSAEMAKSGRATVFRVRLRGPVPAPADRPLDLERHGGLAERVGPGDAMDVTTWRDVQVSVRHDGVSETLPGLPDEKATMLVGLALAAVWGAGLAFVAAFGSARRVRRLAAGRPVRPRVAFGPAKCVGVVVLPLVVAFAVGGVWDAWTAVVVTVVLGVLTAVPVTIAGLRWHRDEEPAAAGV
ncbi:hypothetical protein ACIOHE_14390 [Streptomyces sp. NPDC087851]|uniref:hypothetical protein n=1 Tax=Streptomyces sp. NPDC087851 TaxID=3365810 RepID=UPI00380A9084